MASSPTDPTVHRFEARDGVSIAWRELGAADARPVLLIHGLFSNGEVNWLRYGHAARIAAAGFRVVMPDLRGHGLSGAPHDPAAYPPDILASDNLALLDRLGLAAGDYDLAGYSLGARTSIRMMALGARPGRAVACGMGLSGLLDTGARIGHFRRVLRRLGTHPRGSPEFMAEAFLKTTGGDPAALLPLLDSFVDTSEAALRTIATPTLVVTGVDDDDNGSAEALAAALGDGRYRAVPGNHMSAVVRPELGEAIAAFLLGGT